MVKNVRSVVFCRNTVVIFIVLSIVSLFFMPAIADYYSMAVNQNHNIAVTIMFSLYVLFMPAIITLRAMYLLLNNIQNNMIFVSQNVRYLTIITVCLFVVGIICGIVAFLISSLFAFVCVPFLFMGVVLLVLRNVFDKAVEMKQENDLTI